jgi:hypothetical protein
MNGTDIQQYLFRRIREKLPPGTSLSEVIGEVLHLSSDSAYRRIRGETPLVLEEARVLCDRFGISLDSLLTAQPGTVHFMPVQIQAGTYTFESYLADIRRNLEFIASHDNKEIIYLCKEIIPFHNFAFRPLFAFRYFFWMKSILQHPDFQQRTFAMEDLDGEIEKTGREITRLYASIPSVEIWNTECINSTIAQVAYYREAGYFTSDEDVRQIWGALGSLITHLQQQAEAGCKFMPGENPDFRKANFRFFHNRMVLGDNTILVTLEGRRTLYLNYDVLNYMITRDGDFCEDVHSRLQSLMRRCTLLSGVSEKPRNQFFHQLHRRIPGFTTANTTN